MTAERMIEGAGHVRRGGNAQLDGWWVDGGWGIDALPGQQGRQYNDLDVAIPAHDILAVRTLLGALEFVVERDSLLTVLALCHPDGRVIAMHPGRAGRSPASTPG